MSRISKALPSALRLTAAAIAAILTSCGGDGMGMDPSGMGSTSMGSSSMGSSSSGMSCTGMSGMDNSMSCMAPTVTMKSPGASVNRTVTLTAQVSMMGSDMAVRVDFMVDGASVGLATMVPYSLSWDSTMVSDGTHTLTAAVSDSTGQMSTSAPVSVQVDNHPPFTVAMSPAQIMPAPASGASGTATLAAALANGSLSGKVMVRGVTANAVSINEGFAGNTGRVVIPLRASGGTAGEWDVPAGALLTAEQITALMQGGLYVVAASAANPSGEVRGQITPANVTVTFAALQGAQEVPPVSIAATGIAATTVDSGANTLTVHVHTTGIADAMSANVDNGAMGVAGSMLTALTRDSVDMGHWSTQLVSINAGDVAHFQAGKWYVNVATPVDPNGAIRGQIQLPGN